MIIPFAGRPRDFIRMSDRETVLAKERVHPGSLPTIKTRIKYFTLLHLQQICSKIARTGCTKDRGQFPAKFDPVIASPRVGAMRRPRSGSAKQSCLCAIVHSARRSAGRGQGPGCGGTATVSNRGVFPRVE